jgi:hypothetical protein
LYRLEQRSNKAIRYFIVVGGNDCYNQREAHMLRSITIDNSMLKWIADKINEEVAKGNKITRSFLSKTIWEYERKGTQ